MRRISLTVAQKESFPVREEDKAFIANFFKFSFVGVVLEWIEHDMQ